MKKWIVMKYFDDFGWKYLTKEAGLFSPLIEQGQRFSKKKAQRIVLALRADNRIGTIKLIKSC